jgi:phage host-nuclease inhibitor protein Gam
MTKKQITSREDVDAVLEAMGRAQAMIEAEELEAESKITDIRAKLVDKTAPLRISLAGSEKALKAWAKGDYKSWPAKSLELNFGTIGFRLPKAAIKLKLAVENIIERLRAKKMHTCIRTVEEVDKEALANYDDEVLLDVGCERTKPKDKFFYEVKREEVK